jgi:hypothetical protein
MKVETLRLLQSLGLSFPGFATAQLEGVRADTDRVSGVGSWVRPTGPCEWTHVDSNRQKPTD